MLKWLTPTTRLDPIARADAELNAIPKDERHPFHDLTREEALEWRWRYIEQRTAELKPKQKKSPANQSELNRSRRHKVLIEAYGLHVASQHRSELKDELTKQEQILLSQVGI